MIDKQRIVHIVSETVNDIQLVVTHYIGVGQTKDVRIIKLISQDSVEEYILRMADIKLRLDKRVSSKDGDAAEMQDFEEEDSEQHKQSLQSMIREAFIQADKLHGQKH
jgi:hypothetical protein